MKRHPVDMFSLIAGIVFVVLAAAFASDTFDVRWLRFEWLGAFALLAIGAAILVSTRRKPAPAQATGAAGEVGAGHDADRDADVDTEKD